MDRDHLAHDRILKLERALIAVITLLQDDRHITGHNYNSAAYQRLERIKKELTNG